MQLARLKRRVLHHTLVIRTFFYLVLGVIFFYLALTVAIPLVKLGQNVLPIVMPQKAQLLETNGRTNILLLGVGGTGHDGPEMTDSIALISLKTKLDNKDPIEPPVLISLPRDIYIDELQDKINSAYFQGNEKKPGAGLILAKSVISKVTGQPIHYAVVVDFSVFEKAIDLIGGVDVTVERTFDDYKYPLNATLTTGCEGDENDPCWYEHIHFDQGPTHLNGKKALVFTRSRHAEGDEGSDFARVKRQQLIIQAVKNKVFSLDTLLRPKKINEVYQTFKSHIVTDVKENEFNAFLNLGLKYKNSPIRTVSLGEEFFVNPPTDERGWILLPKDGDFTQIHHYILGQIASSSGQIGN